MASITLKNIVKTYDNKVTVIPGLNLEIHDKEFIILVGPSGCRQIHHAAMIAGLEEITAGSFTSVKKRSTMLRRRTGTLRWFFKTTHYIRI